MAQPQSIPRPLVRLNQWTILLSVLITWATGLVWFLAIPLVANLSGVLFSFNPIVRFGKVFLRKAVSSYIPEDAGQQKFNSSIASFCLASGLVSFLLSWNIAGYIFTIMVAVASTIAILGYCIGCFLHFQLKQWQYRRSLDKA
ncbi:MAG: DUF4395 domain-containing protein [Lysinibacillus sp.]